MPGENSETSNVGTSSQQIATSHSLTQEVEGLVESTLRDETKHDIKSEIRSDNYDDAFQSWYRSLSSVDRQNLDSGIQLIINGAMRMVSIHESNETNGQSSSRNSNFDRKQVPQSNKSQQQSSRKKNSRKAPSRTRSHNVSNQSKSSSNNSIKNINNEIQTRDVNVSGSWNVGGATEGANHRGGVSTDFQRVGRWQNVDIDYRQPTSGLPIPGAGFNPGPYTHAMFHHPSNRQTPYSTNLSHHHEGSGLRQIHHHPGPLNPNHIPFPNMYYVERPHQHFERHRSRSGDYGEHARHRSRSDSRTRGFASRREQDAPSHHRSQSPSYFLETRDRDHDRYRENRSSYMDRSYSHSRSRSKENVRRSNRKRGTTSLDDRGDAVHRSYVRHNLNDGDNRDSDSRSSYREDKDDHRTRNEKHKKETKPTRRSPRKMETSKLTGDSDKPNETLGPNKDDSSSSEEHKGSNRKHDRRRDLPTDRRKRIDSPTDDQRRHSSSSRKKHRRSRSCSSSDEYNTDTPTRSSKKNHRRHSEKYKRSGRWEEEGDANGSKDSRRSSTRNKKKREKESTNQDKKILDSEMNDDP